MQLAGLLRKTDWRRMFLEIGGFMLVFLLFLLITGAFNQ